MKLLIYFFVLITLMSCMQPNPDPAYVLKLKKGLLRSRNVYRTSTNVDIYNEASIRFERKFENQLIELNVEVSPFSTTDLLVLNENGMNLSRKLKSTFYGNVDILMNGQSIHSCLVEQCQNLKCSNNIENDLSGQYSTNKFFLNLSKLNTTNCPTFQINEGINVVSFIHVKDNSGPEFQGARVKAQVITYSITSTPQGMRNAL